MSLFQKSVEKKYLNELDSSLVDKKFNDFQSYFGDTEIQENIRNLKEEEFQEGFIRELFVNILNYTLKPTPEYNIVLEKKNVDDSRKADGAILSSTREHAPLADAPLADAPLVIAVIELKSTSTADLDTVETQAFGYKNHHPECVYVITSNFEKLRFYIQNAVDYLEFDLFNLSKEQFSLLWLCLSKDNILNDLPLTIKKSSVLQEENVTKKLYVDYSKFREAIFENIVKNNPDKNELLLFNKTQKLLDRFLFIFFAEDRLLLPPNSISEIVKQWTTLKEELDAYIPLYDRFKKYFGYMNTGYKGKKYDIFPYNGGLFLPDEILDNITIDDNILHEHTVKLSAYDFETDVDVNILGHIFEHSLAEIENVQAKLRGEQIDKQKTKRKKEGIYYTPKYITKYIVENTVGKLCEEKRNELEIIDEEYTKGRKNRKKDTIKALDKKLTTYKNWLLSLTILDPACGSGAFLNQALEFLINEHKKVDELKSNLSKQTKGDYTLVLRDYETEILEKNIYGVDLNEESVEIAKLSLWLRTAQKGRKLSTLSSNIKCGNSLIDDPEVAGEKAFNWQKEFPEIFQEKEKKAWHVTCATHNSRYSQRMFDNHVKLGDPVWLSEKEEQIVTEKIAEIVAKDELNLLAYNICGDHMHLLLVCEEEELPKIVQKIKSISARACNIAMGRTIPDDTGATREYSPTREHAPLSRGSVPSTEHAPLSEDTTSPENAPLSDSGRGTTQAHLWTQKFGKNEILSDRQLNNTIEYIRNNRQKHELPEYTATDKGACSIVGISEKITCTPDHAFRSEYKGGFDVVIGNPPWGAKIGAGITSKLLKKYPVVPSKLKDTYMYFQLLAIDILKSKGILGLIVPNTWLLINNTANYRRELLGYNILEITDHGDGVFSDAIVESATVILKKEINQNGKIHARKYRKGKKLVDQYIDKNIWLSDNYNRIVLELDLRIQKLIDRINQLTKPFSDFGEIIFGIKPYQVGHGTPPQIKEVVSNRIFHSERKIDNQWKPLVVGADVTRYCCIFSGNQYIKYGKWLMYPSNEKKILNPKILLRRTSYDIKASFDDLNYYPQNSVFIITSSLNLKYVLAILNSRLMGCIYKNKCPQKGKIFAEIKPSIIKSLPFVCSNKEEELAFELSVNALIKKQHDLSSLKLHLTNFAKGKFQLDKISKKLQNWNKLEFKEFLKELKKAKVQLSLSEEAEWMQYFNKQKQKAQELKTEINRIDKEIDQMVYELYDLTEDEIKIVEGEE